MADNKHPETEVTAHHPAVVDEKHVSAVDAP